MKKMFLSLLLVGAMGVSAFTWWAPSVSAVSSVALAEGSTDIESYKVVPAESKITWIGRKVGGEHTGNIKLKEGTILINGKSLRGGTFIMDMTSITCTDITDPKSNERLVKHLKSNDFFSVANNPTAMFAITNLAPRQNAKSGTANYIVTGRLTIKDTAHEIAFPMLVTVKKGVATAKGTLKFDRTKWNIMYRSGSLIETVADKAIEDDVELQVEVIAKQEVAPKKKKDAKAKTAKK